MCGGPEPTHARQTRWHLQRLCCQAAQRSAARRYGGRQAPRAAYSGGCGTVGGRPSPCGGPPESKHHSSGSSQFGSKAYMRWGQAREARALKPIRTRRPASRRLESLYELPLYLFFGAVCGVVSASFSFSTRVATGECRPADRTICPAPPGRCDYGEHAALACSGRTRHVADTHPSLRALPRLQTRLTSCGSRTRSRQRSCPALGG